MTLVDLDVYSPEVDDKGIDFVVRINKDIYLDVQIKAVRKKTSYVFVPKHTWKNGLRNNLYIVLVLVNEKEMPNLFLIPSTVWIKPNKIFVERLYDKKQTSKPEWGINVPKDLTLLSEFEFIKQVEKIKYNVL